MSWYPFEEESWEEPDGRRMPGDGEDDLDLRVPRGARDDEWARRMAGEADDEDPVSLTGRWPLDPHGLLPRERWQWFEQLWNDACMLRERYRISLRTGWWEDAVQVEALAALAAWVERYDSGEWDDPPGKLALLYDLERVNLLLRDGLDPFHPGRDRGAFLHHLLATGSQPPSQAPPIG